MANTGVSYSTVIDIVRSMAHLVGDVPYTNEIILEMVRASLGEAFSLCGDLQERYWSETESINHGFLQSYLHAIPVGAIRVIGFSDVRETSTSNQDDTPWQQASFKEVASLQWETAPERLWAYSGDNIVTSRKFLSATISFVKDPCFSSPSDVSDKMDIPMALLSPILYKTVAKIDAHTNMERAQALLLEANQMIQGFVNSQIVSEDKAYKRRKDFTGGQSSGFIIPTEF